WPPSISRAPMFDPILPMPEMPICIRRSPFVMPRRLFHPVLDLVEGGDRAVVIEVATRRAADADAADRLPAGPDGHAAGREVDVGQAREPRGGHAGCPRNPLSDRLGRSVLADRRKRGRGV